MTSTSQRKADPDWSDASGRLGTAYMALIRKIYILLATRSDKMLVPVDDFGGDASLGHWEGLPIIMGGSPATPEAMRGGFSVSMVDAATLSLAFGVRNALVDPPEVHRYVRPIASPGAEKGLGLFAAPLSQGDVNEMLAFAETEVEGKFWTDGDRLKKAEFSDSDFAEYMKINPINALAAMLYTVAGSTAIERMVTAIVDEVTEASAKRGAKAPTRPVEAPSS